jgi:AraC-like DNA-binding protein
MPLYAHSVVPANWAVEPRIIEEHLIYFNVRNSMEARIEGKRVRLDTGSLIWIRPRTEFSFALTTPGKPIELYRFRLALQTREQAPAFPPYRMVREAWEIRTTFDTLIEELQTERPSKTERLRALAVLIFSSVFRIEEQADASTARLRPSQCEKLREYMGTCTKEWPGPADLAKELDLSLDYFSRLFTRTYGCAPRAWLVKERIRLAAQRLVDSNTSIGQLAEETGYPDVYTFSRQFKKVTGLSPRAYRRRQEGI